MRLFLPSPIPSSRRAALCLCALLLAGCQPAMTTPTMQSADVSTSVDRTNAEWPLKFKAHYFGAHCFDTQRCEILYRDFPHGAKDKPAPSVASYGRPLEKLLTAGRGPIPNFPSPAKITWQSKDGTPLEAEVDIGEIFKDRLIRHNLTESEVTPATLVSDHAPGIILEVNDRTINVYMRAMLWTKEPQIPDNPLSDQRNDLVKVYSRTY